MGPDRDFPRRASRKLIKKRKPIRASSVQYPERLREGEDVQEDVTAANGRPAQYMHKSVFSMIAAAGSKVDFNAPFDEESSESEEDPVESKPAKHGVSINDGTVKAVQKETLRNLAPERKEPRTLPILSLKTVREKTYMSQSTILPLPEESPTAGGSHKGLTPRDAPVMSKMLEAEAELSPSTSPLEVQEGCARKVEKSVAEKGPTMLVLRLKEIFGFEDSEEVISGAFNNTIRFRSSPLTKC